MYDKNLDTFYTLGLISLLDFNPLIPDNLFKPDSFEFINSYKFH